MPYKRRKYSRKPKAKSPRKTTVISHAKADEVFEEVKYLFTKDNPSEWIVFREICTDLRRVDMVLVNCWRSRGFEIVGVEIKTSRSDWLRELKSPEKTAQSFFQYCDRWYIAGGDKSIIQPEEVPINWGLILPARTRMNIVKKAPQLVPAAMGKAEWVNLLRRAYALGQTEKQPKDQGVLSAENHLKLQQYEELQAKLSEIQERVQNFQEASGIDLDSHRFRFKGTRLGSLLKKLVLDPKKEFLEEYKEMLTISQRILVTLEDLVGSMEDIREDGEE